LLSNIINQGLVLQHIQETVTETYNSNLKYFDKHHPALSQKLLKLENQFADGTLKESYALDYIEEYFDVKHLESGNYLYANNSNLVSKQLETKVDFKKDTYLFDGFPMYYELEKHLDVIEDKSLGLEGIYPLMTYYLNNIKTSDSMCRIEKFIFIGTGLGIHIELIHKKINAEEYFIIENDLELFRLSLFTVPYFKIAQHTTLTFSIQEDDNTFTNSMNNFLNMSTFRNKYLKYSFFPAHTEQTIKLIQSSIASQGFISFPYKTYLSKLLRALDFLNSGHNILNILQRVKKSYLSSKPALVLGAGPSLGENIKWIQDNQNRFTIIAVSSTLKILSQYNIKPDIVVHLDGFNLALSLFEDFDAKEFLKDSLVILGSFSPYAITKYFSNENIFFTEEETCYNENFHTNLGPCVGSTSIMHALMLNIENIYLLGLDMAIDIDSGQTHSSGHITSNPIDTKDIKELKESLSFRGNYFPVKGNLQDIVYTNTLFQVSIQTIYNKLNLLKANNQTIYNLSNGAYLEHTKPLKISDLNLHNFETFDKSILHTKALELFKKYSRIHLTPEDIKSLSLRAEYAKECREIILTYKKKSSYDTKESYLAAILGITLDLLQIPRRESLNLINVYDSYLNYTTPIIMDFFNTCQLKDTKKHMKKINNIFIKELLNIADIYESKIETFLKERC